MIRRIFLILMVIFTVLSLSGCENVLQQDGLLSKNSQVSLSESFASQFDKPEFFEFDWLIQERGTDYQIAIPQFIAQTQKTIELNSQIKNKYYNCASAFLDGTMKYSDDQFFKIMPYVTLSGNWINLMILQTPPRNGQGDGDVFCVSYQQEKGEVLSLEDACLQDAVSEQDILSGTVQAYLAENTQIGPQDIARFEIQGVLKMNGNNEYICYLSVFPEGCDEYCFIVGYDAVQDILYDVTRYTR